MTGALVIGRASLGDASQWPTNRSALFGAYPDDGSLTVRILGLPAVDGLPQGDLPKSWECFKLGEIACGKFIDSLDFFVYFAGDKASEIPETPIAEAMARGVIPILSPNFATRFGDGALYCEAREVGDLVRRFAKRRQAWAEQSERAIAFARDNFGPQVASAAAAQAHGRAAAPAAAAPAKRAEPRALRHLQWSRSRPSDASPGDRPATAGGDGAGVRDHEPGLRRGGGLRLSRSNTFPFMSMPNAIPTTGRAGSTGSSIR